MQASDTEGTDTTETAPTTGATSGDPTSDSDSDPGTDAASASATTSGSETEGDTQPDFEGFSDEFDDPATLERWTRRHEAEGGAVPYATLDIGQTHAGRLTIVPTAGGWFNDFDGPFLYKPVEGDFVVEVQVWAQSLSSPGQAPMNLYNSGGLMVRDPDHGDGNENWIIHNVGRQSMEVGVATEGKTTTDSSSVLELIPGTWSGRLRICRLGSAFILTRMLDDENTFTQTHRYERADMPQMVQLGLMANGWNSNGSMPDFDVEPDVEASFEYIRLWRPDSEADCTAP